MYGGAKGGGKSFLECVFVMDWMQYLVDFFELKPSYWRQSVVNLQRLIDEKTAELL